MDDKSLAGFATKSASAMEQLKMESVRLVIHGIIKDAGCTDFEVMDDDLRDKGIKPDMIADIHEIEVPGVTMEWLSSNSLRIVVDMKKYKGERGKSPKLREGKEFEGGATDNYYIFPENTEKMVKLIEEGFNILLIGPAGAGKTELLERIIVDRLGRKNLPFNMTGETTVDDFVGQISLRDNGKGVMETVFEGGPLYQAMTEGLVLQIDELDVAEQEILFVMQRVLEGKDLIVSKNHGERVVPAPGFAVVATSNTAGRGDQADIYRGRQILDEAFLDRWLGTFRVGYLPQSDEIKVLRKRTGIGQSVAKTLTKIASACRASFGREILTTFSLRKSIAVAKLLSFGWSFQDAFKIGVLNKCTDEDAAAIAEVFQRIAKDPIDMSDRFSSGGGE